MMTDDQILLKYIRERLPEIELSRDYLAYYMREKLKEVTEEKRCKKGGRIKKKH